MFEIFLILSTIFVFFLSCFFLLPYFLGAPYDITRKKSLENLVKLTNPKSGDEIAELGSGDGRVCIALAKYSKNKNLQIHGFEINPFLVWISRRKIQRAGLNKRIKIYHKNFWKINLSRFNKIVFFQFKTITSRLEKKFDQELKKGSKVISHNWKLPNWKIKKSLGKQKLIYGEVYLYEKD